MKRTITALATLLLVVACFCAPLVAYADTTATTFYYRAPQIRYADDADHYVDFLIDGLRVSTLGTTSMVRDYIPMQTDERDVVSHRVNRYPLQSSGLRYGDQIALYPDGATNDTPNVDQVMARFEFTIQNVFNDYTGYLDGTTQRYDDLLPSIWFYDIGNAISNDANGIITAQWNVEYVPISNLQRGVYETEYVTIPLDVTEDTRKVLLIPNDEYLRNTYIARCTLTIDASAIVYGGSRLNLYIASNDNLDPNVPERVLALARYANYGWVEDFTYRYGDITVVEESIDFENISWTQWLGNAIGGVFDVPLFGGATLGTVLGICVALGVVMFFLKKFAGG